jgi:hypothetical protein
MRIVSLCPSLTELVFDLGLGASLVGVTKFCVHPADGVRDIEKVGGTKTPTTSRIVELEPDLVLLNEEENRREDATRPPWSARSERPSADRMRPRASRGTSRTVPAGLVSDRTRIVPFASPT